MKPMTISFELNGDNYDLFFKAQEALSQIGLSNREIVKPGPTDFWAIPGGVASRIPGRGPYIIYSISYSTYKRGITIAVNLLSRLQRESEKRDKKGFLDEIFNRA